MPITDFKPDVVDTKSNIIKNTNSTTNFEAIKKALLTEGQDLVVIPQHDFIKHQLLIQQYNYNLCYIKYADNKVYILSQDACYQITLRGGVTGELIGVTNALKERLTPHELNEANIIDTLHITQVNPDYTSMTTETTQFKDHDVTQVIEQMYYDDLNYNNLVSDVPMASSLLIEVQTQMFD